MANDTAQISDGKRRMSSLARRVDALAEVVGDGRIIRLEQVQALAIECGCEVREVEIAALEAGVIPWRYVRNVGTIGLEGQARLLQSTVAVVGLGGLGGYVTEALARMGVGRLILIDGDVFEEHNLNRQILSAETRLGMGKAETARQRVAQINGAVAVDAHAVMLTRENLPQLLAGADVVVDALDRLPIRVVLQDGAQALSIPMVHGSIAGFLGQVMTILPGDPGLRSLYGETDQLPEQGLEAQLGTPAATPMAVAAWEVQEVVKILVGRGELLRHRLLVMDMESGTVEVLRLG
jgi:molybdopterin/thiamine biosynthesis adenylyltransferase